MPPSTRTACFARVTAANFCFFLTFASFFLLPLHVRALGGTERTIGLVMGTSGLAGLVSVLAVGALLDRFGRRIFLLGGIATMSAAAGAFLLVDRIGPAIFALRALQGLQRRLQPGHDGRLDGARPGGACLRASRHVPGRGGDGRGRARDLRLRRAPGQSRAADTCTQRVISATTRSGRSSCGRWPVRSRTRSSLPAMSAW